MSLLLRWIRAAARWSLPAIGLLAALLSPVAWGTEPADIASALADCDEQVRRAPESADAWDCYPRTARRARRYDEAARALEARLALDPGHHWARYALGAVLFHTEPPRAEELLRQAADGFLRAGGSVGEAVARRKIASLLIRRMRLEEVDDELERGLRAARKTGDWELEASLLQVQAVRLLYGEEHARAWSILRGLERSEGFESLPFGLRVDIFSQLGNAYRALGRDREAMRYLERARDLMLEFDPDSPILPFNLMELAGVAAALARAEEIDPEEPRRILGEARRLAARQGNLTLEAFATCELAQLLEPAESLPLFESCIRMAADPRCRSFLIVGKARMALNLAAADPGRRGEAHRLAEEALRDAEAGGNPHEFATAKDVRAALALQSAPRDAAVAAGTEALGAIERIRDLQIDEEIRARAFSQWVHSYQRLAGWLLAGGGAPPATGDIERAHRVLERMRARVLLDALDGAGASGRIVPEGSLAESRRALLREISATQRRLADVRLDSAVRRQLLDRLEALELDEAEARQQIAIGDQRFAVLREPDIPTLEEVRSALGADEALLSFQIADEATGGSWLLVHAPDGHRAYGLPGRKELKRRLGFLLALLERRDGSEAVAASSLYGSLLDDALRGMPQEVTRLVIVPDGPLHRLPFGALRSGPQELPIATRYAISTVPSATLWMRWRSQPVEGAESPAIVLADPALPSAEEGAALQRTWAIDGGARLGPLPHARIEGRDVVRSLGGGSRLLAGEEASERFLKSEPLGRYGILHFAAHALVDDARPERSAVLLAPGDQGEDGLLQVREVVDLDLRGRVVVLAACRGASGTLLEGEGVMSLARGFFQAGARAVVASLWPLRDEEAATLFGAFYRRIGEGRSVADALGEAARERIAAGAPAAAWSGLVVLGEGRTVPVPGGARPEADSVPAFRAAGWVTVAALLIVAAILLVRRRRAA